jgi:hypothetical protein
MALHDQAQPTQKTHFILAGAYEGTFAGERAYALATLKYLAKEKAIDPNGVDVHLLKSMDGIKAEDLEAVLAANEAAATNKEVSSFNLDQGNDSYAKIPFATNKAMDTVISTIHPDDTVVILGTGHSTLKLVNTLKDKVSQSNIQDVAATWMSHNISSAEQVATLSEKNIRPSLPEWITKEALHSKFPESNTQIDSLDPVYLAGVPTGNTQETIRREKSNYLENHPAAQATLTQKNSDEPEEYVVIIPNAGFAGSNGREMQSPEDYYQQGVAIASQAAKDVKYLIIQNGPRAIVDEQHLKESHGETPNEALIRGITDTKASQGLARPVIAVDRFDDVTPSGKKTNGVVATLQMLTEDKNCLMVIIPDEAEGSKFDVVNLGLTDKVFSFKSSACDSDPLRVASRNYYNKLGVTTITPEEVMKHGFQKPTNADAAKFYEYQKPEVVALTGVADLKQDFTSKEVIYSENFGDIYSGRIDQITFNQTFSATGKPQKLSYSFAVFPQQHGLPLEEQLEWPQKYNEIVIYQNGKKQSAVNKVALKQLNDLVNPGDTDMGIFQSTYYDIFKSKEAKDDHESELLQKFWDHTAFKAFPEKPAFKKHFQKKTGLDI